MTEKDLDPSVHDPSAQLRDWPDDLLDRLRLVSEITEMRRVGDRGQALQCGISVLKPDLSQKKSAMKRTFLGRLSPLEKRYFLL